MKLRIVPLEVEHYRQAMGDSCPWLDVDQAAREHLSHGPAFSGLIGDDLAACAGVMIPWVGLGEAWAVLTPLGRQHPMMVHRAILRFLRSIIEHEQLVRVHADAVREFHVARRWLLRLGFRKESVMRRYGPGPGHPDFVRYVWLRPLS